MATKVIVALEDDLEGGPAAETLRFGLAGSEYEIDLNEKNAARLRKQLAPFVEHARRAGRAQRRAVRTAASRRRSRDIRSWAQDHGIELSERGRIPASVVDQYEAAARRGSRLPATAGRGWADPAGRNGVTRRASCRVRYRFAGGCDLLAGAAYPVGEHAAFRHGPGGSGLPRLRPRWRASPRGRRTACA
jgi:Lsr2